MVQHADVAAGVARGGHIEQVIHTKVSQVGQWALPGVGAVSRHLGRSRRGEEESGGHSRWRCRQGGEAMVCA